MKKTLPLWVMAGILGLSSCQKDTVRLPGIYSFETQNGQYAEVWIDSKKLSIIKADPAQTGFFLYDTKGDTLRMFRNETELQNNQIFDQLYLKTKTDTLLEIVQDSYTNTLKLVTREVPQIKDESTEFIAAQRLQYTKRTK